VLLTQAGPLLSQMMGGRELPGCYDKLRRGAHAGLIPAVQIMGLWGCRRDDLPKLAAFLERKNAHNSGTRLGSKRKAPKRPKENGPHGAIQGAVQLTINRHDQS